KAVRKKRCLAVTNSSSVGQQTSLPHVKCKTVLSCNDAITQAICGSPTCNPYKITPSELIALQGTGWLSDAIVSAAQFIISQQFPDRCKFQDVLLGQKLKFKKQSTFVQILHIPNPGHWATVTNYGAPKNTIFLHDSLDQNILLSVVHQVMNIMNLSSNYLDVDAKAAQCQRNGYDCGIFAIANAYYAIASGADLCSVSFNKCLMLGHIITSLADGQISPFPLTTLLVPRVKPKRSRFVVKK
ncbi:uncharacterized protein LOC142577655, partial [Dermacentor variabilis]|uniref:uncharacterized protein LOC142577655 n=1 Tax=Dermacentor variabilis TaxID=34621 RepID=UPI003F5C5A54